jgi:hypothetical protein
MTHEPTGRSFVERGLHYPVGIAVGLGLMVLWNVFFVHQALSTAPDVDPAYTHATHR